MQVLLSVAPFEIRGIDVTRPSPALT